MAGRIKRPDASPQDGLPRIGMIKTGYKDDRGYPRSVDYFIATGKYSQAFHDAYGDKPSKIHIVFMSDDPAKVCEESFEYRDNKGALVAKGDGQDFKVYSEKEEKYVDFNTVEHPDLMERIEKKYKSNKGWETTLRMRFIIPKISGIAGSWEYITKGSSSTIPNVVEAFDTMKRNVGFVKGLIFDMTVEFAKSQKPNSKSRYPVVNIVGNMSETNIALASKGLIKPNTNVIEGGQNDKRLGE